MCGIIGITGSDDPAATVLRALETLEYRGYDSAGIAVVDPTHQGIWRARRAVATASVGALSDALDGVPVMGSAVGHTRWATHGEPNEENAHPHLDCSGRICIVHNGIIENHRELADELAAAGHAFVSATDTEVVAHLLEDETGNGKSLFEALRSVVVRLRGDFAFAALSADEPEVIVAARRASPLVLGLTDRVGVVGSDVAALLEVTRELYTLDDDEIAEVRPGELRVVDAAGHDVTPHELVVTWDVADAKKGGFEDFMSKEMREQPRALAETLIGRVHENGSTEFEELAISSERLRTVDRVVLVGCGSSYHTSLVGRHAIERYANLPAEAEIASEFRYRDFVCDENTLVILVSQSGETIDTLHAMREASRRGALTVAVTNVVGSLMTREADGALYTHAGPEIGVAGTKCTLAQIALLEAFALHLGRLRQTISDADAAEAARELLGTPVVVESVLGRAEVYEAVARQFASSEHFFYLGRRTGFPTALEGALKLKELAYVRAEAYPAGELKHGPIALIDKTSIAVAIATRGPMYEKILSNIAEVRARGATVVAVVNEGDEETAALVDAVLEVPSLSEIAAPLADIVPLQFFAYAIARERGNDVDRPRNLAKVVTVE